MTAPVAVLKDVQKAITTHAVKDHGGLIRHLTDLFIVNLAELCDDEIALFDDVLNELIREIDTAARALLALRLATVQNAPLELMHALAIDDEPDVACPVLANSPRLDDSTLVMVARLKSQEHMFAISRRQSISETVTDALLDRADAHVLISTAGNAGARWSEEGFERLVGRAEGDDDLAVCVARRTDIPSRLFAMLIRTASEHVRARLEAELPHVVLEIRRSVQSAAIHVAHRHDDQARDISAVRAAVGRLHKVGQLDDEQIRQFAQAGLVEEVKIALSLISDLPAPLIGEAFAQESAEMLLVITRATGLSWATLRNILRLPIWRRPATSGEIRHCLARFEKLGRTTASDIMRFYKARF